MYRKVSNIRRALVGYKIVDHSDVVGASPVGVLQLHLHSQLNTWLQWIGQRQLQDETRNIHVLGLGASYIRELTVLHGCFIVMRQMYMIASSSMVTSSNGSIFRVTGLLCGEFTGHRWIPRTKASDRFWCFLWSASEPTVEHTMDTVVIWDAIALIMTSLWWSMK